MKNKVNNSLLNKLGLGITLTTLVFSSVTLSGCGRVYFPVGKYPHMNLIQERDAELRTKDRFYKDKPSEPVYLLVYELK